MFVIHYPCSLPANFAQQSPPETDLRQIWQSCPQCNHLWKKCWSAGVWILCGRGVKFCHYPWTSPCPWGGCYLAARDTRNAVLASAAAAVAVVVVVVAVTAVAMYCRTVVCRTTEDVCTLSDRNIGAGSRSDLSNRDRSLSEDAW